MKLLTKEILNKLPALYATDGKEIKDYVIKFFTPDAGWTWYAVEGDAIDEEGISCKESGKPQADFMFFGYVEGFEKEWG